MHKICRNMQKYAYCMLFCAIKHTVMSTEYAKNRLYWSNMQKMCTKYARNKLKYADHMQVYAKNMKIYANNIQEICQKSANI